MRSTASSPRTFLEPSLDLQSLIAAGKRRTPRHRRSSKAQRKSEVAGAAVVAALIGAEFVEKAEAAEDLALSAADFAALVRARICSGHAGFTSRDDHHASAADADLSPLGHNHNASGSAFAFSANSGDQASRGASFDDLSMTHADHSPRGSQARCRIHDDDHSAGGKDDHASGGGRGDDDDHHNAGGDGQSGADGHAGRDGGDGDAGHDGGDGHAGHDGGGGHSGHDGGGDDGANAGGGTSGGGSTGGHTHNPTNPTLPHPNDPAMQKEHLALMNLVPVSAATHVAVSNGSWFDPNTWANGQVPGDDAKVLIPSGVTVDYDGSSNSSIFTVRVDGQLDFATDVDTFMEVDTFVVAATGTLTIGTEGNPVDPNVNAVISFADNGPINVAWDPMLLSRGLVSHGTVDIHGAEKETFLKVAVDPMKGDTTLTLEAPPAGWQVGDKLVLTGTHLVSTKGTPGHAPITAKTEDEELVITAINGNVVTLDRALQYDHEGARADLKAYVANYSRNVTFENEGGETTPTHERGHVMLMHSDNIVVKYAEFDELGRTDKSVRSFDIGSLSSVAPDSNVRGRYSLHVHRAGVSDQENPAIVEGNAVWGSPGWGFVHHDSNAMFSNNAAYDVFGAAFVAETGNETGRWDHNIAIKSLGVNHITKDGGDVGAFDLGRTGTGFWFQGRMVEAADNVAAGVPSGAGFTYFHRGTDPNNLTIDPANAPMSDSLRYLDFVRMNEPNIALFLNNESFATERGLEVIKANPRQDHDVRSVIDDLLAWEVKEGVHLQYTGHYTIKDLDIVASDTRGIGTKHTVGLNLGNNVFDVVVNGANIEGFYTGVRQAKTGVSGLNHMNGKDQWDYVYIDVTINGAQWAFTNKTAGDQFLTAGDLVGGRLFYNSNFADTHIVMKNGVFNMLGTKTDSIGKTESYEIWDPDYINTGELRGSIEQNGYWTTADGRRVALIEEYVSDRATGEVIKVGLFVEIPSNYVLQAGKFTRLDPSYNGLLDQNSKAPLAVDDTAQVQQGKSVVIDLLANDMDPDGDAISLDGIFSQHGHVVANKDGTVTYFADSNFAGQDTFYYWVQDSNGDMTKAQVTVTVDI